MVLNINISIVFHFSCNTDFWAWSDAFISHKFQKMKNNTYIYIQYHFYVKLLCIRYFSPLKLMYSPGSVFIERNWPAVLYRKLEENVVPFFTWNIIMKLRFYIHFLSHVERNCWHKESGILIYRLESWLSIYNRLVAES